MIIIRNFYGNNLTIFSIEISKNYLMYRGSQNIFILEFEVTTSDADKTKITCFKEGIKKILRYKRNLKIFRDCISPILR